MEWCFWTPDVAFDGDVALCLGFLVDHEYTLRHPRCPWDKYWQWRLEAGR